MQIIEPAAARSALSAEAEVVRLQAQVARLQAEREALRWAAGHDELTGLPNRRLFTRLAPALLAAQSAVVFVLDLNGFKPVNDHFGHDAGDCVLRLVAQRLAAWAGDNLVARLGGDEFAGVMTRTSFCEQWWYQEVSRLSDVIAEPICVAGQTVSVTASIGVAQAAGPAPIGELLQRADLAMYQAKQHMRMAGRSGRWAVAGGQPAASPREAIASGHPPSVVELTVSAATVDKTGRPTCHPQDRAPATVAPAGSYRYGEPVWVYREGHWLQGVVEAASERAVLVRYTGEHGPATHVDTVWAVDVAVRPETLNR